MPESVAYRAGRSLARETPPKKIVQHIEYALHTTGEQRFCIALSTSLSLFSINWDAQRKWHLFSSQGLVVPNNDNSSKWRGRRGGDEVINENIR